MGENEEGAIEGIERVDLVTVKDNLEESSAVTDNAMEARSAQEGFTGAAAADKLPAKAAVSKRKSGKQRKVNRSHDILVVPVSEET